MCATSPLGLLQAVPWHPSPSCSRLSDDAEIRNSLPASAARSLSYTLSGKRRRAEGRELPHAGHALLDAVSRPVGEHRSPRIVDPEVHRLACDDRYRGDDQPDHSGAWRRSARSRRAISRIGRPRDGQHHPDRYRDPNRACPASRLHSTSMRSAKQRRSCLGGLRRTTSIDSVREGQRCN